MQNKKKTMFFLLLAVTILLTSLSTAVYIDTGQPFQNVDDCGTLSTNDSVFNVTNNIYFNSAYSSCFYLSGFNQTLHGNNKIINLTEQTMALYNSNGNKNINNLIILDYGDSNFIGYETIYITEHNNSIYENISIFKYSSSQAFSIDDSTIIHKNISFNNIFINETRRGSCFNIKTESNNINFYNLSCYSNSGTPNIILADSVEVSIINSTIFGYNKSNSIINFNTIGTSISLLNSNISAFNNYSEIYISATAREIFINLTNTFQANVTPIRINFHPDSNGTLIQNWYLDVNATNASSSLFGVNISILDKFGNFIKTWTNASNIIRFILPEFIRNNTGGLNYTYFSNYSINISKDRYNTTVFSKNYSSINLTTNIFQSLNIEKTFFINLTQPQNNTVVGTSTYLACNFSNYANLSNISIFLWNSTNGLALSWINSTTNNYNLTNVSFAFPYSNTFHWNCLAYDIDNQYNYFQTNYTIIAEVTNPIINQISPTKDKWVNYTNNQFNCTFESNYLDSAFLYANFSGSFILNNTIKGISSGQVYAFNATLQEGSYLWTCRVNKTVDSTVYTAQQGNYTLNIDITFPKINISSILTTDGSQTFTVYSNQTEAHLNICKYSIYNSTNGTDGTNNNITFSCNTVITPTATNFGDFNLVISAIDFAGNYNQTNKTFTISHSQVSTGGGGGSESKIAVIAVFDVNGTSRYNDLSLAIIYSLFNNYCSDKLRQGSIATDDYSDNCVLNKADVTYLANFSAKYNLYPDYNRMSALYKNYKEKRFFKYYATESEIKTYNLFSSTLGITNALICTPPSVDKVALINTLNPTTKNYTITCNKILKVCDVIDGDMSCLIKNSSIIISMNYKDSNFFNKVVQGLVSVTTDAKESETKRIPVTFRTYNLAYKLIGIPYYAIFLLVLVTSTVFLFLMYKNNKLNIIKYMRFNGKKQ